MFSEVEYLINAIEDQPPLWDSRCAGYACRLPEKARMLEKNVQ
jgi:hypothetical protein